MINPFYELTRILGAIAAAPSKGTGSRVHDVLMRETGLEKIASRLYVLKLLDEASDAFTHSNIEDHRVFAALKQVDEFKYKYIVYSSTGPCSDLTSKLELEINIKLFNAYGDTISTFIEANGEGLDRAGLKESTLSLMEDISNSDLPDYPKKVLSMKVKALSRILMECETYTDGEIRRRVKAVYADFCAEFREHDAEYEVLREKVYKWARQGAGYGLFALALTADASAVAGLITDQSS